MNIKKSLQIRLPRSDQSLPSISISIEDEYPKPSLNIDEYHILSKFKDKIDDQLYNKDWDIIKKMSNEYELIYISSRGNIKDSIANYNPLSRSFFKLWEMLWDFKLIPKNVEILTSGHIAEGPGGFVEAFIKYRQNIDNVYNDNVYGITLKSDKRHIPGWKKSHKFLKTNRINVSYGIDGTGNIYSLQNILHFRDVIGGNLCDLVTADGGFDFSIDFNKQEQLSYRLLFCQIVAAISIQKKGGSFICKIFDTYCLTTIKLIWLINCLYECVYVSKPVTSRPANSEKYIIATNYQGISSEYLSKLYQIVDNWDSIEKDRIIVDLFGLNFV